MVNIYNHLNLSFIFSSFYEIIIVSKVVGFMGEKLQKRIIFGYNRNSLNKFEINQAQALTARLLYELYADVESMGAISAKLEACNIPSPYNNSKWGKQAIAKILSYERYVGDEDYPQIIDTELFERVQNVRKSKQNEICETD